MMAPMGAQINIINVLLAVDTVAILKTADSGTGTPANPVYVDESTLWMVTRQADAVFGNGTAELKLTAQTEDLIRWRGISLSLNGNHSVIFYKFQPMRPNTDILLSPPVPLVIEIESALPNPANLTTPNRQTLKDYFYETTVEQAGETVYALDFMIVDRNGQIEGYFSWDPFIQITD